MRFWATPTSIRTATRFRRLMAKSGRGQPPNRERWRHWLDAAGLQAIDTFAQPADALAWAESPTPLPTPTPMQPHPAP